MAFLFSLLILLGALHGQTAQDDLAAARALRQAGNNQAALSKLNQIAAAHPGLPGLDHELGVAYYETSDYLRAIAPLTRALEQDKNDRDAVQLLGLAHYLSGQPALAIPYLERLQSEGGAYGSDAAFVLASCYALTKDYERALGVVSKLYGVSAGSASSRLIFARILLLLGLDAIAEQQTRQVLQTSNPPLAHFVLGRVYLYRADLPHAIAEFQNELAVNPAYAPAMMRLGEAYARAGRPEEAELELQRSLWLDANDSESYVLLAKVMLQKRQFARAPRLLQRALALDPNDYTAHNLLGEAYRELGQTQLATREMEIGARLQRQQTSPNRR